MRTLSVLLCASFFVLGTTACTALAARVDSPPEESHRELVRSDEFRITDAPAVTVKHKVSRQTYAVAGSTLDEVRSSLTHGPPFPRGVEAYEAQTQWNLRSTFRYVRSASGCGLAAATIELDALVILPELIETATVGAEVLERWRAYRGALEGHEGAHVDRHLEAAERLADGFAAAAARASCMELMADLQAMEGSAIEAIRASDSAYDAETRHGAKQGAVFP